MPTRYSPGAARHVAVAVALVGLAFVPVFAGLARLAGLMTGQISDADVRFLEHPLPITLHILAVIPYSLLGALQFVPALRRTGWHRAAGLPLVPLGMVVALSGLWMTQVYPWPAGDGEALYAMRLLVGVAMTASIGAGVTALWRRDYAAHGAWMLRAYALAMGAGTQVLTHLPWFIFVNGTPDEISRALMMGSGWAINLAVAEAVIRSTQVNTRETRAGAAQRVPMTGIGGAAS